MSSFSSSFEERSELLKSKSQGQVFFSTTKPGFVRGNHFHRKRVERFCVLKGKALIEMRKVGTDEINKITNLNQEIFKRLKGSNQTKRR